MICIGNGSNRKQRKNVTYIMDYILKNVRNRKSILEIPKWPSLRSLALKSKFINYVSLKFWKM